MDTLLFWSWKIVKVFGIFLISVIILVNLFIVLSGRFYIYKGLANTYFIGKAGPDIYDLEIFPYSTIRKADKVFKWQLNDNYNTYTFNTEEQALNEERKTTAFLVFKNDTLLFQKYFEEHTENTVSNSFSAAKTVIGLLIGIALDEGKIKSLDEPVGNYIESFKSDDKKDITIHHLLQMASGLDWQESGVNPLSENAESYYGSDLMGMVNRQKGIDKPGEKFNYQSGNSQTLGFILKAATGKSVSQYAEEKLWRKIGTQGDAHWNLDKKGGDEKAFCCLYATAQDFARIGRLILNEGNWNGEQVISKAFMQQMTANRAPLTENGLKNNLYGNHIWLYHDGEDQIYYCRGISGQYIAAIPSKKLVFVRLGHARIDGMEYQEYKKRLAKGETVFEKDIDQPKDFLRYVKTAKRIAAGIR
jgi:CubicO group peptidase (beta-lactamase class C family)